MGTVLAHQHMLVEFGVEDPAAYLDVTRGQVFRVIGPLVQEVKDLGYSVFVDPTMEGVGRRPDLVTYVARRVGMPTMMVTGFYWDPYIPDWVRAASVEEITDWLLEELYVGVGNTRVRAGWIKLSQSWGGITADEMKILEAACEASKETGAAIGSHILSSWTALAVLDALEGFGCDPHRFIWIHAPYTAFSEPDGVDALLEAASRGAYISDDFIGSNFWAGWLGGTNPNVAPHRIDPDAGGCRLREPDPDRIGHRLVRSGQPGLRGRGRTTRSWTRSCPTRGRPGSPRGLIYKLLHTNPWNAYSR